MNYNTAKLNNYMVNLNFWEKKKESISVCYAIGYVKLYYQLWLHLTAQKWLKQLTF